MIKVSLLRTMLSREIQKLKYFLNRDQTEAAKPPVGVVFGSMTSSFLTSNIAAARTTLAATLAVLRCGQVLHAPLSQPCYG